MNKKNNEPCIEISVDVDGLVKHVMEKADQCYSDDFPIQNIEIWIREFFKGE